AMALIDEDKHLADGFSRLCFNLFNKGVKVVHVALAELVDKRAQQPRFGLSELAHKFTTAARALDRLTDVREDPLNLLIELVAIRDDRDTRIGIILQNPLGKQHHHDALP